MNNEETVLVALGDGDALANSSIAHQFSGKPNQISKSHNRSPISSKGVHSLVYGCLVRSLPWESRHGKHIQPHAFKIKRLASLPGPDKISKVRSKHPHLHVNETFSV